MYASLLYSIVQQLFSVMQRERQPMLSSLHIVLVFIAAHMFWCLVRTWSDGLHSGSGVCGACHVVLGSYKKESRC
jgi:hypothetical protein